MTQYCLGIKVGPIATWSHDPSIALFQNGELLFAAEEERFCREKHANGHMPKGAIEYCLDEFDIEFEDIDRIALPISPPLLRKLMLPDFRQQLSYGGYLQKGFNVAESAVRLSYLSMKFTDRVEEHLSELGEVPPIETYPHHDCHAASALYPAPFDEGLVITIDGQGEYDSTVVWRGTEQGLERIRTYEWPNSLGQFFAVITKYLGYRPNNGEGKVMGLAPYGSKNSEIESALRSIITTGVEYDVRDLVRGPWPVCVDRLEDVLERPSYDGDGEYDEWYQDLAYTAQKLLEETVTAIVSEYIERAPTNNIALAGGVALSCKMNKRVMELPSVNELFVQPVANDAGVSLGAGILDTNKRTTTMTDVYLGPEYSPTEIESLLQTTKIDYSTPDNLERKVAKEIADGQIVGWFQGRMELGPRALGNRSILADPRTIESRDRVNKYVKHREEWRPFAPSMIEAHADEYLENAEASPFMIKTFDVKDEKKSEIPAVLHPGDNTTRPQTVTENQNPRYYRLISEFEELTGVPVILNTSYNDHGEPIVNKPVEALKDFYGMGLDLLVLGDYLVQKGTV